MNEDQRNEKIGRAVVNVTWFLFALKFIGVVTVIAGIVLYIINRPLWIAPVIGVGAFVVYKLLWKLVWMFIEWASR
ncbi:MAG: hypothetical protein K5886_00950 [Lachnospiraceae bacterium]|nr:hypothetical protein [Lachnospiraceae bacterium]